eukprot:scaffold46168_cov57-Phaeocystis_antarctica.AAC.2
MEVGMVARPRAASVPSRLELLDGSCWERQHTPQVAPQLADASLAQLVSLSSTVGPRDSFGAPAAHRANSLPAPCLPAPSPKRQASPGAPSAPLAKKTSGARAWSPYHAYCQAEHVEGGLVMWCRLTSLASWTWPSGTWLLRAGRSVDSAASDTQAKSSGRSWPPRCATRTGRRCWGSSGRPSRRTTRPSTASGRRPTTSSAASKGRDCQPA